jgi:hypothetical protein
MTRRSLFLIVGGALLGLLAWWFTQNFGFGEERVWVGYSGEARINRFFAARLLLEKLGYRVQQKTSLRELNTLAPRGVLLLGASRMNLDRVTAREILAWVQRGGHLILGAEHSWSEDPLMDLLGIEVGEEERGQGPSVDTVRLPDGTALRVELTPSPPLIDEQARASWTHESEQGVRILQIVRGDGRITIFATLQPFTNRAIGRHDHAELLAWLAASDSGEVWIVRYLDAPSLLEWLWAHAAETLIALGVFLLLWLWRVVLRFGPLRPSPVPDRKSLVEHVRALGKFYAHEALLPYLLQRVRADAQAAFDRAVPELRGADASQQLKEASRLTRIRARDLLAAFTQAPHLAKDFTHAVRALALLRTRLRHRPKIEDKP